MSSPAADAGRIFLLDDYRPLKKVCSGKASNDAVLARVSLDLMVDGRILYDVAVDKSSVVQMLKACVLLSAELLERLEPEQ